MDFLPKHVSGFQRKCDVDSSCTWAPRTKGLFLCPSSSLPPAGSLPHLSDPPNLLAPASTLCSVLWTLFWPSWAHSLRLTWMWTLSSWKHLTGWGLGPPTPRSYQSSCYQSCFCPEPLNSVTTKWLISNSPAIQHMLLNAYLSNISNHCTLGLVLGHQNNKCSLFHDTKSAQFTFMGYTHIPHAMTEMDGPTQGYPQYPKLT